MTELTVLQIIIDTFMAGNYRYTKRHEFNLTQFNSCVFKI